MTAISFRKMADIFGYGTAFRMTMRARLLDLKALKEYKEFKATKAYRATKEYKAFRATKVYKAFKETKVYKATLVLMLYGTIRAPTTVG